MRKTILVTGGNRGIGKAICTGLAAQGHHVLLGCRKIAEGQVIADSIGSKVTAVALDLSDVASLDDQIDRVLDQFPKIDVLVNNAAILSQGNGAELSIEDFISSLNINVVAPLRLSQRLLPGMSERSYGRIVNLSSGWGAFSANLEGPTAYAVSKAALNALTVKLAATSPNEIKINAMCPGWVKTDMGGQEAERTPEEGAATAIWLATLPEDGPTGGFFRDNHHIDW